jgi:hypothetical protein
MKVEGGLLRNNSQVLMTHTYNPSYSGDRDQEDCDSKLSQANSSQELILKKPLLISRAGGVVEGESPEFKPQNQRKKK